MAALPFGLKFFVFLVCLPMVGLIAVVIIVWPRSGDSIPPAAPPPPTSTLAAEEADPEPTAVPTAMEADDRPEEVEAAIEPGLNVTFLLEWFGENTSFGTLRDPRGLAVDHDGNAWVLDHGPFHGGQGGFIAGGLSFGYLISPTGELLRSIQPPGDTTGIGVGLNGELFVGDLSAQVVNVLAPDGEDLAKWGQGELSGVGGISVNSEGNVYVGDFERLLVFDSHGAIADAWGASGAFAIDNDDLVYVADSRSQRVQVFESDGTLVRSWGLEGGDGQFSWGGIAVDDDGNLYVPDFENHQIQVFDSDGAFVGAWGTEGEEPGEFMRPRWVAVGQDGIVYVVDNGPSASPPPGYESTRERPTEAMGTGRVQVFRVVVGPAP